MGYIIDKLHVDHVEPVVPVDGSFNDLEVWKKEVINRMFVDENNLQLLCGVCHYFKTQIENDERRQNNR